ncbi:MAG: hypothetical protein J0J05_09470 [Microbacterium sp.]|uniref:DUF6541 family protein n=1 Tax=Microbacterium sp. TaxID=51671 RepID=UPI001AC6CF1F|nr:DUF6541 family protein [Microbacterium sp.]MBN9154201.1 hypothetical protein [Microbacterium sp.]
MISEWIGQWLVLLTALAVAFVPGLLVGARLRLRGLALWALAPVGSTLVIAVLAVVFGALRIPWSPLWAVVGCLVVAALGWLAGIGLGPRRPRPPRDRRRSWLLIAGLAIGIALTIARFVVYVHDPRAISQTNDAVFHLNALRYILDTGSASSLHVSGVIGGSGFYPAAWHGLASLVAMISGCQIPVAANMITLVIVGAVWPVGMAWFAREVTGGSDVVAGVAAALSAALWAFPMLMVEWGVLYPYTLSLALLPAAAAVVVAAPRWAAGAGPVTGTARSAVLTVVLSIASVGALALSQPASILSWAVVAVAFFTWWAVPRARGRGGRRGAVLIASLLAAWLAFVLAWVVLTRSTTGAHWPPFRGKLRAALDVVWNGQVMLPAAVGVSILMVIGLVVAVRRPRLRWLATTWLVFSLLYYASAAIGQPLVRRYLLGAWYADPYRFAALAPLTVVPLAAIGVVAVATWAVGILSRRRGRAALAFAGAWSLAGVTVLMVVAFAVRPMIMMPNVTEDRFDSTSRYTMTDFLSPDERVLLERLPKTTPPGARVIGNPSTGMAFGYMLSGRDVYPRTWQPPQGAQWAVLAAGLRDAGTDPAVCTALAAFGSPRYVVDFGPGEATPGRYVMPGFSGLAGQPGFELVDHEGDASLWRITACAT